jgi:hypothetical protein
VKKAVETIVSDALRVAVEHFNSRTFQRSHVYTPREALLNSMLNVRLQQLSALTNH